MNDEVKQYISKMFNLLNSGGIYVVPQCPPNYAQPTIRFCKRFGKLIAKQMNDDGSLSLVFRKA